MSDLSHFYVIFEHLKATFKPAEKDWKGHFKSGRDILEVL